MVTVINRCAGSGSEDGLGVLPCLGLVVYLADGLCLSVGKLVTAGEGVPRHNKQMREKKAEGPNDKN